jgi:hypothetical protein
MICLKNEHSAKIVSFNPCLIPFIESFQVINPDGTLIFTASFLYLVYQCGNRCSQVKKEIGAR